MSRDAKWYADWVRLLPASSADEKMRNLEAADMLEDLDKRVPRWISVEERLPEDGVEVIVHSDRFGGSTHTAYYRHARQEWFEHNGVRLSQNVWHWMPRPEPPEE